MQDDDTLDRLCQNITRLCARCDLLYRELRKLKNENEKLCLRQKEAKERLKQVLSELSKLEK